MLKVSVTYSYYYITTSKVCKIESQEKLQGNSSTTKKMFQSSLNNKFTGLLFHFCFSTFLRVKNMDSRYSIVLNRHYFMN